jgi:hypothetical protein
MNIKFNKIKKYLHKKLLIIFSKFFKKKKKISKTDDIYPLW